jgi:hypothetical protein
LQHSPLEEKLRAKQIQRDQLEYAQTLAIQTFREQGLPETQLERSEILDGEGNPKSSKQTRRSRHSRPDAKMLDRYVLMAEKIALLDEEIGQLRSDVHQQLSVLPDWKEDHDAHFAVRLTEELERYNQLCKSLDRPTPELPREERWETEEWTRMERRENPKGGMWDCVHPKWVKVAKQVFMPHLDPNGPMPRDQGDLPKSKVVKKDYPPPPPSEPPPPPSPYEPGTFWDQWHKHLHEGGPWQWTEAPPGGDGVTYPDGSWSIPDGTVGGGPPGQKSIAQQVKEARERGEM